MKKILTILLAASMLLSVTACSQNAGTSSTADSSSEASAESSEESMEKMPTKTDDDPFLAPMEEPVTLTLVREENNIIEWPEGDSISNNVWTRAYKDDLNIELDIVWESNEYATKLNLSMTQGELPDFFTVDATQFQTLYEAGLLMELDSVYDEYLSDDIKAYHNADEETFQSGYRDGKLYGIPQMHYGVVVEPDYIWLRSDWMKENGFEAPETVEDLENILMTFMDKYGVYGLGADRSMDLLNLMAPAWHAYPDIWVETENGIEHGAVQPEMKDALATWADWYQKGILSEAFPTKDVAAVKEDVVSGKVGAQPFYQYWGWEIGVDQVANNGPEALFEPYALPSVDGEPVHAPAEFGNFGYVVVSKDCENPEAVMKLINYYDYIQYNSLEDIGIDNYNAFTEGNRTHFVDARVVDPTYDHTSFLSLKSVLDGDAELESLTDPRVLKTYNDIHLWMDDQNSDGIGRYLQQNNVNSSYIHADYYIENDLIKKSMLWGETPSELASYGTTLDDLLTEGYTKIIIGSEPIDYFDTVVANWKTAGGDTVTEAMNARYGS